ncbi:MAG: hypothetical protein WBP41_08070 [Saprospiraceae bacterium]
MQYNSTCRKSLLLVYLTIGPFLIANLCSQMPSSKFGNRVTPSNNIKTLKENFDGFSLLLGYEHPYFLNTIFEQNVNKAYERGFNYYLGGRLTLFPFFLESSYFNDAFKVKALAGINQDDKIRHRGFELTLGIVPLPFSYISKLVQPRIGFGYQYSQLCLHCSQTEDDADDLEVPFSAIGTSGFLGKFGIAVAIKNISIETEIKQSINQQSKFSLFEWRAGVAIRPIIIKN